MSNRYQKSEEMLKRALNTIPLASQTFSKSMIQYPFGVSPYFIERGYGSRVWDVDGNEYIDFVSSLASVTLGYSDPDVTAAVKAQLQSGVIFSLPHPLEHIVAEKIVEIVPCAEKVRFGKNGSDATSGAVRLARAFTGREHIACCGYHGWQDWYIGTTSLNKGVPKSTRDLTHVFAYNDIDSLNKIFAQNKNQIAAVIMEPMNMNTPMDGFLEEVKSMAHANSALLVFDETITGFRFANGGAQEYFGVIPDLATFGKGLANGYPLSAIAGRADVMDLMKDIFFSFTFGGETLSLAAAAATLKKIESAPVIETLWNQGAKIVQGTRSLIDKFEINDVVSLSGKDCWSFLVFKDVRGYSQLQVKTLFLQEVLLRGILTLGTHNMSYAHSDNDISILLGVYEEVFLIIKESLKLGDLKTRLRAEPIMPLFKVR